MLKNINSETYKFIKAKNSKAGYKCKCEICGAEIMRQVVIESLQTGIQKNIGLDCADNIGMLPDVFKTRNGKFNNTVVVKYFDAKEKVLNCFSNLIAKEDKSIFVGRKGSQETIHNLAKRACDLFLKTNILTPVQVLTLLRFWEKNEIYCESSDLSFFIGGADEDFAEMLNFSHDEFNWVVTVLKRRFKNKILELSKARVHYINTSYFQKWEEYLYIQAQAYRRKEDLEYANQQSYIPKQK